MYSSKKRIAVVLLLLLITCIGITGCTGEDMQSKNVVNDYLSKIENTDIADFSLTIYYIEESILTRAPLSIDDLINYSTVKKVTISGNDLSGFIESLNQTSADDLKVAKKDTYIDARVYYVLEGKDGEKILDVVMFGNCKTIFGYSECIFINGLAVEWNSVFFDILLPILPDDTKKDIEAYL
ncbi:MAG: hypothetical protein J6L23_04195 [Clostridia bacterium]|nr:hypothetical protein [Clostridia bacterium]